MGSTPQPLTPYLTLSDLVLDRVQLVMLTLMRPVLGMYTRSPLALQASLVGVGVSVLHRDMTGLKRSGRPPGPKTRAGSARAAHAGLRGWLGVTVAAGAGSERLLRNVGYRHGKGVL